MIYIDTSSLVKLLLVEPESVEVEQTVRTLTVIVVSSLTELEAKVQAASFIVGGRLSGRVGKRFLGDLKDLLKEAPFVTRDLRGDVFNTAIRQHGASAIHCRSLDRLHLAAMEELGITRLMTLDTWQADAARELGNEVLSPGI